MHLKVVGCVCVCVRVIVKLEKAREWVRWSDAQICPTSRVGIPNHTRSGRTGQHTQEHD